MLKFFFTQECHKNIHTNNSLHMSPTPTSPARERQVFIQRQRKVQGETLQNLKQEGRYSRGGHGLRIISTRLSSLYKYGTDKSLA
jgi:hypothetical protein